MSQLAPRPLRADARRNRERVLTAAKVVFGEHGREAQMDDVARRAGVGVGTVYRHFPTKEALVDAVVREGFEEIAGFAREALDSEHAWDGFERLIWRSAERNAADRGFCEAIAMTDRRDLAGECGLDRLTQELLDRAKAQGTVRADASAGDVSLMMCALGAVMRLDESEAWRRYLTLMLDGLRAS
jgi:AcrR family transcriptional regulator